LRANLDQQSLQFINIFDQEPFGTIQAIMMFITIRVDRKPTVAHGYTMLVAMPTIMGFTGFRDFHADN
jgi:hypothetical protein